MKMHNAHNIYVQCFLKPNICPLFIIDNIDLGSHTESVQVHIL